MATLYLANTRKQHYRFTYRLPEDRPDQPPHKVDIAPGRQQAMPHNADRQTWEGIVEKYLHYGWASLDEMSRLKQFSGVIYSFDKPIPETAIFYLMEFNEGRVDEMAHAERMRTALAASSAMMEDAVDRFGPDFVPPRAFETKWQEQEDGLSKGQGDVLSEVGVRVDLHSIPRKARRATSRTA